MVDPRAVDRLWYGDDAWARAARAALWPAERAFGLAVGVRGLMYDAGVLRGSRTAIPAVSVGNLSVGGTGKTPVSAWIARGLADRGVRAAVVLSGYATDEPEVHRVLNPDVTVVAGRDRVAAISRAAAEGARIAVLDDAFQHRRARRVADVVLVNADRFPATVRLLPAGPFREPLGALSRATLVVVTRKSASPEQLELVHRRLSAAVPMLPRVSVHLAPLGLARLDSPDVLPLAALRGRDVRAVSGIADPGAFQAQLRALGARVEPQAWPDHHEFTPDEVARMADAPRGGLVVCTLKDAVKLAPRWPPGATPLWYLSQQVIVDRGEGGVDRVLDDLARAHS
jgi:tetraacyldisaccharide 4'-kinase